MSIALKPPDTSTIPCYTDKYQQDLANEYISVRQKRTNKKAKKKKQKKKNPKKPHKTAYAMDQAL